MKRAKHSLSHYKLLTCDMGKLVPIAVTECLPGDTIQQSSSMLVRMSPLMAPVMHPVSVRVHHWFVPNRLSWSLAGGVGSWEDFITGGKDGLGNGSQYPDNAAPLLVSPNSVLDYMGVKPGITYPAGELNMMPLAAYNLIFNEFYRDQDLINEVASSNNSVLNVAWEKDYFTASRPWAQKGPQVTIPLGLTAPVVGTGAPTFRTPTASNFDLGALRGVDSSAAANWQNSFPAAGGGPHLANWNNTALEADLAAASSPDIIEFRRAFALQRYQEARAQYGSRYTEYLRYLGVRSSDARLQRPEYLGGGKQTVSFSEVLRTGNDAASTDPIGEMKGHGISAMRSNRYRYFCEEHGYIISVMSLRPRSMYVDGINRTWSRRTKEEYWQKELELIGMQEILNKEVYADGTAADNETFGYQDRYAEYRHTPSTIAAEFRNLLDYWHLARKFASLPVLNQSFVECDPSKRIFAEQTQHSCWIMASHSIQARRMVGAVKMARII